MTTEDKQFIEVSRISGNQYGYPQCCIDEFVSKPPSVLRRERTTSNDLRRFKAGHINGQFTGFIPCLKHANEIHAGTIKLESLINNQTRKVLLPFPHDWSLK